MVVPSSSVPSRIVESHDTVVSPSPMFVTFGASTFGRRLLKFSHENPYEETRLSWMCTEGCKALPITPLSLSFIVMVAS